MSNYRYEIGHIFNDNNRKLKIISREKRISNDIEYNFYGIQCLICGFTSGMPYYKNDINHDYIQDKYMTYERNLAQGKGCPCCNKKIVVTGINDINTTNPLMSKYFVDDNYLKYCSGSTLKLNFKCPCCNLIKENQISIRELEKHNGFKCINCDDGISYPNKFSYFLFQDVLSQLSYYENEYSPKWIGKMRYDNYFEIDNEKFIVEMDGGLGHGRTKFKSKEKDIESLKRDNYKDILAKEHNINVIRIDATKSDEFVKNKILNSELSNIIDFSEVDWEYIFTKSESNLVRYVCDLYNKTHYSTYKLSELTCLDRTTISKYLKRGNSLGWCNYKNQMDKRIENIEILYKFLIQNNKYSVKDLSNKLNHDVAVIWNWINELEKTGKIDLSYYPNINRKITSDVV